MLMRYCAIAGAALALSCGGSTTKGGGPRVLSEPGAPPPGWANMPDVNAERICGIGVAGAAYSEDSPYPKRMSEERAVRNLAGVLGTVVQEAIIDRETHRGISVRTGRALHVDEALIEKVAGMVDTQFWLDHDGTGPFASKGFTYAHSCIDVADAESTLQLEEGLLVKKARPSRVAPDEVPSWTRHQGKQAGGRLCAVGFSLPMFHPDKTFEAVVEDVRAQLAEVIKTFVSSYYEELTTNKYQLLEAMTVATTDAISKGAVVTHYWYDRDGLGVHGHKRTTYGWGCVYPIDVLRTSAAQVQQQIPEAEKTIAKVRERAELAFDALDAEIEKRESAPAAAPEPQAPPPPPAEPTPEGHPTAAAETPAP